MRRAARVVIVLLGALGAAGCGSDNAARGINAACTRTSDCQGGLTCISGLCEPADAGIPSDTGSDSSHPDSDGSSSG